jgi:sulfhydrogenase subunit alpha
MAALAEMLIERYEPPAPCYLQVPPHAAVGRGATQARRGVLFHRYAIDAPWSSRVREIVRR